MQKKYSRSWRSWSLLLFLIVSGWPMSSWAQCVASDNYVCPGDMVSAEACSEQGCFLVPWARAVEITEEIQKAALVPRLKIEMKKLILDLQAAGAKYDGLRDRFIPLVNQNRELVEENRELERAQWGLLELVGLSGAGVALGFLLVLVL
jgi:hypothetical protein